MVNGCRRCGKGRTRPGVSVVKFYLGVKRCRAGKLAKNKNTDLNQNIFINTVNYRINIKGKNMFMVYMQWVKDASYRASNVYIFFPILSMNTKIYRKNRNKTNCCVLDIVIYVHQKLMRSLIPFNVYKRECMRLKQTQLDRTVNGGHQCVA